MSSLFETTISETVSLTGFGVHSGAPAKLTLHPALSGSGYLMHRSDLSALHEPFSANYNSVLSTQLCTVVGTSEQNSIATVEHLFAALRASGIDNVLVTLDGPEMPIMDGSSEPFMRLIESAGMVSLRTPRRYIKVLKHVRVEQEMPGLSAQQFPVAELRPCEKGFKIDITVDFAHKDIGTQQYVSEVTPQTFSKDLARARTFGFMKDVEALLAKGLARGASTDNTVVLSDDGIVNPDGLRWSDEFVRHKALDAVGDLALAGLPIQGSYKAYKSGHRLNVSMLKALFSDPANYMIVEENVGSTSARQNKELSIAYEPSQK